MGETLKPTGGSKGPSDKTTKSWSILKALHIKQLITNMEFLRTAVLDKKNTYCTYSSCTRT